MPHAVGSRCLRPIVGVGVPPPSSPPPPPPPPVDAPPGPQGVQGALGPQGALGTQGVQGAAGLTGASSRSLPATLEWGATLINSTNPFTDFTTGYLLYPWEGANGSPQITVYATGQLTYPIVLGTNGTVSAPRLSIATTSLTAGPSTIIARLYIDDVYANVSSTITIPSPTTYSAPTVLISTSNTGTASFTAGQRLTARLFPFSSSILDLIADPATAASFTVLMTATP